MSKIIHWECCCGRDDHEGLYFRVPNPGHLHPELAEFVVDMAGYTHGSEEEPPGVKGEIEIHHRSFKDGRACEVWSSVHDGERWRNIYRHSGGQELGPSSHPDYEGVV